MQAKIILVPTDFSACSRSALQVAIALARGGKPAQIRLLHVVEPVVPTYDEELGVLEPQALRTQLAALAAGKNEGVELDAEIRYGGPAEEIHQFIKENEVELVVMGTRGRNPLLQMLVGSTAEAVMRKAKCPVLTVHDPAEVLSTS